MEENYLKLGLAPDADKETVEKTYKKLCDMYNPDKFTDKAQKKYAEKSLAEITKAYNEIMKTFARSQYSYGYESGSNGQNYSFDNRANTDRAEYFLYIRQLIQNNDFVAAINSLKTYRNVRDRQWNFLMGCAMYYNNDKYSATVFLKRAVSLDPTNMEYKSVFKMN